MGANDPHLVTSHFRVEYQLTHEEEELERRNKKPAVVLKKDEELRLSRFRMLFVGDVR